MLSSWHKEFFNDLEKYPVDTENYRQFTNLFNVLFGELDKELTVLQNSDNKADNARYCEYEAILKDWHGYKQRISSRKNSHFGYPMHLSKRSFLVDFFRVMESFEVIQNNFGDIHDISDIEIDDDLDNPRLSGNNYAMDTKSLEWDIVRLIADNMGLPPQPRLVEFRQNYELHKDGYWGYVTSGGSESNLWGVLQGFSRYPEGILYFSEGAHYSVPKAAKDRNFQIISQISADDDAVDVNALITAIKTNWRNSGKPAIVVLTFGTTKYGSIDDVATIKKQLTELQIPHYLHVDAAFYGGIPKNQDSAPKIGSLDEWGFDSIAVSLHKYIGYPAAKGVLISTKRPIGTFIDYIGQEDNTVLGSRDVPAFSLRQQIMEVMKYSAPESYARNINAFEERLILLGVKFGLWSNGVCKGNTFVFLVNKSSPDYHAVCKRWQLSEFAGKDGLSRIHAIISLSHTNKDIEALANDISKITVF